MSTLEELLYADSKPDTDEMFTAPYTITFKLDTSNIDWTKYLVASGSNGYMTQEGISFGN